MKPKDIIHFSIEQAKTTKTYLHLKKPYSLPQNYMSPSFIWAMMAIEIEVHKNYNIIDEQDNCKIAVLGFCFACLKDNYQMFWIKESLLKALLNTSLPKSLDNFHSPVQNAIFILPKSINIPCPDGGKLEWIGVNVMQNIEETITVINCVSIDRTYAILYNSKSNIIDGKLEVGEFTNKYNLPINDDNKFLKMMRELTIKLLLYLAMKKEIIEIDRPHVPKGFGKKSNKLSPNFIGEEYKIKYKKHSPLKKKSSPREHWRSGHIRNQLCKDGVKQIWIEPVLVNAE